MRRTWKRGWRELIFLLAALACAGVWVANQVRSVRDRSEVAKMTEKMKTICVGRFLIDVPLDAEVRLSRERIAGFEIVTTEESVSKFRDRIAERQAEIEALGKESNGSDQGGLVEARDLRAANSFGRVFVYGYKRGYLMDGERRMEMESVSVEAHSHIGGYTISLSSKHSNERRAKEAESLLAQMRLIEKDEIPSEPGFCIGPVLFAEPLPAHKSEHIAMALSLPGHPDLALALNMMPGGDAGPDLLERTARADAEASADELLRVAKLRESGRSINGIVGQESLERVREINFTTGFGFMWESRGVADDLLKPYLTLELQTGISPRPGGKPVDSSLHEDAVLALWENISSTIRLRKSEPPVSPLSPEPDGPKLGAIARAGDICPQSGWWECSAGGDGLRVHGGQVQFLRKGTRVPQPLLLPQQTLWQRLKGVQPSIEPDHLTVWQLVDKRSRPRVPPIAQLASAGIGATALDVRSGDGPGAVLGSYVRTGDACPASGWWRCEESHALDGTRWFAAGSLLPAATFRVPQGVFGRAAGPEVIQRRSAWQLVRHAEASSTAQHVVEPVATGPSTEGLAVRDEPPLLT